MAIDLSLIAYQAKVATEEAWEAKTRLDSSLAVLAAYQPPAPVIHEAPLWPMLTASALIGLLHGLSVMLLYQFQRLPRLSSLSEQKDQVNHCSQTTQQKLPPGDNKAKP